MSKFNSEATEHVSSLNIDAAAESLYGVGKEHGWWRDEHATFAEFREKDPIGYSELLPVLEEVLLHALYTPKEV